MSQPTSQREEWLPVKGFEGCYEVSNLGRIKSVERKVQSRWGKVRTVKPRFLKSGLNVCGYPQVSLSKDGKAKTYRLHRIVALAFIINKENKPHINHLDNNRENAAATNLEWCTPLENTRHGIRFGNINFPNYDHSILTKTHCPQGHVLNEETQYFWKRNKKMCKKCKKIYARRYYEKKFLSLPSLTKEGEC